MRRPHVKLEVHNRALVTVGTVVDGAAHDRCHEAPDSATPAASHRRGAQTRAGARLNAPPRHTRRRATPPERATRPALMAMQLPWLGDLLRVSYALLPQQASLIAPPRLPAKLPGAHN